MSGVETLVLVGGIIVILALAGLGVILFRRSRASRRGRGTGSRNGQGAGSAAQGAGQDEKPAFGLFGAVTSAISIVPDVGRGTSKSSRDEDHKSDS